MLFTLVTVSYDMANQIERARKEVQRASDEAEANVREQLLKIVNALEEMEVEADEDEPAVPQEDYLEEVEEKIVGLATETEEDSTSRPHLETARNHLDSYRREHENLTASSANSEGSDDADRADRG